MRATPNPLLLTTLLLVKRWVGELPAGRSALYNKAIEVLLITWNVEAHQKLEFGEVVPQLAFLAFTMMKDGVQQVSERRLRHVLTDARRQMEDLLAYTRDGVDEFIRRVEHRSSLLVQSGHTLEDGRLWLVYEFRHLTFQEYLAAIAVAEGYYPEHHDDYNVLAPLRAYILNPDWTEVIPLAAVLAERKARPLIECLIELCETERGLAPREDQIDLTVEDPTTGMSFTPNAASLLAQCMADGVPLPPPLAERALMSVTRSTDVALEYAELLVHSRYGELFESLTVQAYTADGPNSLELHNVLGEIAGVRWRESVIVHKSAPRALGAIKESLGENNASTLVLLI